MARPRFRWERAAEGYRERDSARLVDGARRSRLRSAGPLRLGGLKLVAGMARGEAVFHQPRVVVEHTVAEDTEAERERVETLAMGNRDAEVIRGEGDAKSAATYAAAYQRYPEFYSLHRSLEAYRNSIGKPGDVLVISPKGEFFKYLKQPGR